MLWTNPIKRASTPLGKLFSLPEYVLWAGWGLMFGWFLSRQGTHLVLGIPAIVLLFVAGGLFLASGRKASLETVEKYVVLAREAMDAGQTERAQFLLRRLDDLHVTDDQVLILRAELYSRTERQLQADNLMKAVLANTDPTSDGQAHAWLAKRLLSQLETLDARGVTEAIDHLHKAFKADPANPALSDLLADLHATRGYEQLTAQLEPMSDSSPVARLMLAKLHLASGLKAQAEIAAKSASVEFEREITSNPESLAPRFLLADSLLLLNKFSEASSVLSQARAKEPGDKGARQLTANMYIRWSDFNKGTGATPGQTVDLLEKALDYVPDHPLAVARMLELVHAPDSELAGRVETRLQQLMDKDIAPPELISHFADQAITNGDLLQAEELLQAGCKKHPKSALLAHRMADFLLKLPEPRLKQALLHAQLATGQAPPNATHLETLGRVLLALDRPQEAMQALESAKEIQTAVGGSPSQSLAEALEATQVKLSNSAETATDSP